MITGEVKYFTGIVESTDDPLKLGRSRVRCFEYHSDNLAELPIDKLLWMTPVMPPNSLCSSGVGQSPNIETGAYVFGLFIDYEKQVGLILGTMNAIPTSRSNGGAFNDPNWIYPSFKHDLNEPDTNRLFRSDPNFEHPVVREKRDIIQMIQIPKDADSEIRFSEQPANRAYGQQHVIEYSDGSLEEYQSDVTNSRLLKWYPNMNYFYELGDMYETAYHGQESFEYFGSNVTKTYGDGYDTEFHGRYKKIHFDKVDERYDDEIKRLFKMLIEEEYEGKIERIFKEVIEETLEKGKIVKVNDGERVDFQGDVNIRRLFLDGAEVSVTTHHGVPHLRV